MIPLKALVNEDTLLRTHCCPWCFLGCANWETFVTDIKCFWTKSETFFVSRTQNLCPQQMLHARANGETFVWATMCPQQCVLVCQGLNTTGRSDMHCNIMLMYWASLYWGLSFNMASWRMTYSWENQEINFRRKKLSSLSKEKLLQQDTNLPVPRW